MLCSPPKLWDLSGTRGLSMCAVKGESSGAGVNADLETKGQGKLYSVEHKRTREGAAGAEGVLCRPPKLWDLKRHPGAVHVRCEGRDLWRQREG